MTDGVGNSSNVASSKPHAGTATRAAALQMHPPCSAPPALLLTGRVPCACYVPAVIPADCLYDCDIPSDVEYLHVQLVAKELPPLEFVREVARAANNFWARHPDQYIAIHCAYGGLCCCSS